MVREYSYPEEVTSEGFRFGAPQNNTEYTAKDVMFPRGELYEKE